jgi:hypothetical protein
MMLIDKWYTATYKCEVLYTLFYSKVKIESGFYAQ